MIKIIKVLFFLLILVVSPLKAQEEVVFSPGAPGVTTGPDITPLGKIDWETGMAFEWNLRNGGNERTWTMNTSLIRIGITHNTELNLQLDESATFSSNGNYAGISNAAIGAKIRMYNGKGALPQVAFLGSILIPGGHDAPYLAPHLGVQAHLLFQNDINEKLSIGYEVGADWNGDTDNPDIFFGANLTYQPTKRWTFLLESTNTYNSQKQDDWARPGHTSHFDCMAEIGAGYMITPRFQINMYGDMNFNEVSKYLQVGVGVAWLLN